jgi:hypothetical protein
MEFKEVLVIKNDTKKEIENLFQHFVYSCNTEFRTG